jgi:L-alanine-DL-glutamate epimerase-like enolase superfamily enzyme
MLIDSIEAIAIDIPLKRNFGGATYSVLKRSTVITRIRTAEGLASEVYNGDDREHGPVIARLIEDGLAPRLKGMSIFDAARAWDTMFALTHHGGQDARRHRARDGELPRGGHGRLQVQGRGSEPRRGREATRIPVTAGQCEITSHGVRRLVDAKAVDFVNYDASEGGGVTDWRRAAAICQAAGVEMAHHEEPQIAGHLLAGVPHGTCVECFADPERDPVWQALWANRPAVKDGTFEVPETPGFGIELDWKLVERYRVA